jgi:hypothetical protein
MLKQKKPGYFPKAFRLSSSPGNRGGPGSEESDPTTGA